MQTALQPVFEDVLAAAARIAPHAHATPVLRSRGIDAIAGCSLHFKAEPLQRAGAFKFRGACNAVWSLDDAAAARGVVTHSSRSEEHTSELQSLMRISYAVFCLKKKTTNTKYTYHRTTLLRNIH